MTPGGDLLVVAPGFMASPRAYSSFSASIEGPSTRVVVVPPVGSVLARLAGRISLDDDTDRLIHTVRGGTGPDERVWIGGHSRGGGVAWLAARQLERQGTEVGGVVLLDPVWGDGGPRTTPPPLPTAPTCPILIVGFGIAGRCTPADRDHEVFHRAAPDARHVIVPQCGHGDILDDGHARLAAALCRGGPDRTAARAEVARLVDDFLHGGD